MTALTLGLPSKGRLMEAAEAKLKQAGFAIERTGRGYSGVLKGAEGIEISFLAASEIAIALRDGKIDLGITGEDLLTETIPPEDSSTGILARLDFGPANVVVAVPTSWLDVASMSDLDDVSAEFYARHGRRLRVATKYRNLTRRFFAEKGVTGYRIVESTGATEGAPAAGIAEIIVDITTSGATLKANHLKVLDDGLILESQAILAGQAKISSDVRILFFADKLKPR
jgi:ATP phosphoribosyltransferase